MHYWYFNNNNNNNNNNNDCQYDENFYPDIMTRTKKSEVNAMASSGSGLNKILLFSWHYDPVTQFRIPNAAFSELWKLISLFRSVMQTVMLLLSVLYSAIPQP